MLNWLSTLPIHTFDVRDNPINDNSELEKPLVVAHYNASKSIKEEKKAEEDAAENDTSEAKDSAADEDGHCSEPKKIKLDS